MQQKCNLFKCNLACIFEDIQINLAELQKQGTYYSYCISILTFSILYIYPNFPTPSFLLLLILFIFNFYTLIFFTIILFTLLLLTLIFAPSAHHPSFIILPSSPFFHHPSLITLPSLLSLFTLLLFTPVLFILYHLHRN